jgi:DNA-binding ferritin-like protein (Dps family)
MTSRVRDLPQINLRFPTEVVDVLEAAVFVRDLRGPQELLGPVVTEHAAKLLEDEAVQAAVSARERVRAQG